MPITNLLSALPYLCPACEQPEPESQLCLTCRAFLAEINLPCPSCSRPLSSETLCGHCLQQPPPWDAIHTGWNFTGLCRYLIHQFKYQRDLAAGRALTKLWLEQKQGIFRPEAVMAVPMHYRKQHHKGFNQADWLARRITKQWQLPLWQGAVRQLETPALEGLKRKERQKELAGAFKLTQTPPASIAIIDDVYTSGATLNELTKVLKRAGCKHVSAWVIARTPLGEH